MTAQVNSALNALELARRSLFHELKVFRSLGHKGRFTERLHRALRCFFRELSVIPGGRSELLRRGSIIRKSSSPPSDYYYVQCDAMYWASEMRGRQKEFDLCIEQLRCAALSDLGLRKAERLIDEARRLLPKGLHHDADQSFSRWQEECRQIRARSVETGAEGCHYLIRIAGAIESSLAPHDPDDNDQWPSASMEIPPSWIRLWRDEIEKACLSLTDWAKHQSGGPDLPHESVAASPATAEGSSPSSSKGSSAKPNASTERGEAQAKIVGALNKHHGYANGSCSVHEPIGVRTLAKQADVGVASVSDFFKAKFKSHRAYKHGCADKVKFSVAMQLLNGDILPKTVLFGRSPDAGRDDDE